MKVKKVLVDMILKWHEEGISLDETAKLIPQVSRDEIEAIIQQHRE
ncbi:antitoxin [Bifidobacterium adolescentis]